MGSLRTLHSLVSLYSPAEDVRTYNFGRLDLDPVMWYTHDSTIQYRLRWEQAENISTGYIILESRCGHGPYGWEIYDFCFYHARYKSKSSSENRFKPATAARLFQEWASTLETQQSPWTSTLQFPHRWIANLLSPFSTATFLNFIRKTPDDVKASEMVKRG